VRWCADGDFWRLFLHPVFAASRMQHVSDQSCAMVPRWPIFGNFFRSCISSEPRAAHFGPAFKIRTKATLCVEVWQTSNLRQLRLREEKKEERRRRKKPQDKNIMVCPIKYGDHNEHFLKPTDSTVFE